MEKDKDGNYDPVTVAAIRWGFDPDQDETLPEWIERQCEELDRLRNPRQDQKVIMTRQDQELIETFSQLSGHYDDLDLMDHSG